MAASNTGDTAAVAVAAEAAAAAAERQAAAAVSAAGSSPVPQYELLGMAVDHCSWGRLGEGPLTEGTPRRNLDRVERSEVGEELAGQAEQVQP